MRQQDFNRWLIELWSQEHSDENMAIFSHILSTRPYKAWAGRVHKEDVFFKNINAILQH